LISTAICLSKTINIQEPPSQTQSSQNNDNSTISISDLKDLQSGGNMPKRSKRRQKSASNTVSLDI
jgi:biopolymer transport protein ExbD